MQVVGLNTTNERRLSGCNLVNSLTLTKSEHYGNGFFFTPTLRNQNRSKKQTRTNKEMGANSTLNHFSDPHPRCCGEFSFNWGKEVDAQWNFEF